MVKFGRHQQYFVQNEHPDVYIVPYNETKTQIEDESQTLTPPQFEDQWREFLDKASTEFQTALKKVWQRVFAHLLRVQKVEEARGATPEKALLLFMENASQGDKAELLEHFKSLHAAALINAEALRKLVKKFDKNQQKQQQAEKEKQAEKDQLAMNDSRDDDNEQATLSCKLLPEVYAANFVIGLSALQQGTDLLRSELGLGEFAPSAQQASPQKSPKLSPKHLNGLPPKPPNKMNSKDNSASSVRFSPPKQQVQQQSANKTITNTFTEDEKEEKDDNTSNQFRMLSQADRKDSHAEHTELVDRRRQELLWLRDCVSEIRQGHLLPNLVAHRGFHSPKDRSDRRPLENSLQAYEMAWTSGIHLCECDISMTKDEQLILAHDEDFSRLALDTACEKSNRKVRDLTFQEIMSVALSSGSRPPLLLDVLQSAHAIGGQSQLIIEIKPGNREAASALARLFAQHPYLMAHCAVVMSFDSFAMHSLKEEMDAIFGSTDENNNHDIHGNNPLGTGHRRSLSLSHRRTYSLGMLPSPAALAAFPIGKSETDLTTIGGSSAEAQLAISDGTAKKSSSFVRPKLLVLTVCDDPRRDVELQVSVRDEDMYTKISHWLSGGRLDGVYMQFEPAMLTPEGAHRLKMLSRQVEHVGVWGHNGRDPDDYHTFSGLVQDGNVSFVNSDLPRDFFACTEHPSSSQSQEKQ